MYTYKTSNHEKICYKKLTPKNDYNNLPHVIWGHGWAQTHATLLPLATNLQNFAHHWLLDFPGFGSSFKPEYAWSINDYARIIAKWITKNIPPKSTKIWVGHSFGCRVGINLAANYQNLLDGLFLIAAAGIPKKISLPAKIVKSAKIGYFKILKNILLLCKQDQHLNWLKTKFGSHDYRNADPLMRNILVKILKEDLSNDAKKIFCPTELLYGQEDQETPLSIGYKLQQLIKDAKLHILSKEDHYSILQEDAFQVTWLLKTFITKIQNMKINCTKIIY